MKALTSLQATRRRTVSGLFWVVKANGVHLGTFVHLGGEHGLLEYIRTRYTRADGSQLTLADIRAKIPNRYISL